MHRRGSRLEIETLLTKLRARIPDISIRTTFITGLPGEDEEAFENLCAFVRDQNFARMGVFVYSPQDGTEAADMVNQVDADTAERRKEILTEQFARQQEEKNDSLVGQNIAIITEDYDGYSDCYIGRTTQDAPDIDCVAYFTSKVLCNDGDIIRAEVLGQRDGDLLCKWVGESPFGISAKNPK
jgi:ribosomal protein S12 methylthiotransferase